MAVNSGNGWMKFALGTQVLKWNTGVANVFTSDPSTVTGEELTAATVGEGDTVGDGYDTTYWTYGEGPVECVLTNDEDAVIYSGTPFFRAEGGLVTVHPTQDQIESGRVGNGIDHSAYLTAESTELLAFVAKPAEPSTVTGVRDTAGLPAIVAAILTALDTAGVLDDQTTAS